MEDCCLKQDTDLVVLSSSKVDGAGLMGKREGEREREIERERVEVENFNTQGQ